MPPDDLAPDDLTELFARDPQQLTDRDEKAMIAKMREDRAQFRLGEKVAPKKRAKKAGQQEMDI
jgi:hypothetical protein